MMNYLYPQQVTTFGERQWSVGLHILSLITRNLFKNAIMMSAGTISWLTRESIRFLSLYQK